MRRSLALSALLLLATACDEPHGWFNGQPRLAGFTETGDTAAGLCFGFSDIDQDGYGANNEPAGMFDCLFVSNEQGDCDDYDDTTYPGAQERCDGIDSNCNGVDDDVDESAIDQVPTYLDLDGDGYGVAGGVPVVQCPSSTWVANDDDCDASDGTIHPGAPERCDGVDNDCDGLIDVLDPDLPADDAGNIRYADLDGDLFGNPELMVCRGAADGVENADDCNDSDPLIGPDVDEVCDGIDNNCSGVVDDITGNVPGYTDADGDGWGGTSVAGTVSTCTGGSLAGRSGDCNDNDNAIYPGAPDTPYDGVMNDCNLAPSADCDADGDGFFSAQCSTVTPFDCDDVDPAVHPGAIQLSDSGVDSDCDGDTGPGSDHVPALRLNGVGASVTAADLDGDGYRELLSASSANNTKILSWPATLTPNSTGTTVASLSSAERRYFTEAMDLDRDGADDVLAYTKSTSATVTQIAGGLPPATYTGSAGGGQQRYAVADVDNDGWGDVFSTQVTTGGSIVLRHYAVEDHGSMEQLDLLVPTNTVSMSLTPTEATNLSLATVGDMDGDGYGDVAVGVPEADFGSGPRSGARQILAGPGYVWDDGAGYVGGGDDFRLGLVSAIGEGDFNGDGYADDLTAAVFPTVGTLEDIEVFVVHGRGTLFTDGQLAYDSFSLPTLGTNVEASLQWAGDVDSDGYDDFWVAYAADGGSHETESYLPDAGGHLVFGLPSGFNGFLVDTPFARVTPTPESNQGLASGIALIDLDGQAPLDLVLAQDDGGPALLFTGVLP